MFDEPEPTDVRRIFILFSFLAFYLISLANNGTQIKSESRFNWITIWLSFFFGVLFTMLFRFLNSNSKTVDQRSNPALPVSGWIMFLGINLIVRIFIQSYFFWNANYFLQSTWVQLEHAGGVRLQTLFIFEMFLSLFALTGTGALIYWFYGRRDIFPVMFIYYVGFYLITTSILMIIYPHMALPAYLITIRHDSLIQILRIAYAAVWVIFVLRSEQVKQTFVYPPG